MFEQTLLDAQQRDAKRYTMLFSLILQVCVLGVLILVPLIYTQVLPGARLHSVLAAPKPPSPPLPKSRAIENQPLPILHRPNFRIDELLLRPRPKSTQTAVAMPSPPTFDGVTEGPTSDLIDSTVNSTAANAPELPPPGTKSAARMRIGGGVIEANLIHRVKPVYPPLARSIRIQGVVEFTATIGKTGNIENLELVSGHPALVEAAKQAILQWKYRPTMLNGEPVEVITDIKVNFTLTQ